MTTFLGRKPQEIGWTEMDLNDSAARRSFVEGDQDCIALPMSIDLWVNDEYRFFATNEKLSVCILQKDNQVKHVYGNVYLAGVDENGETIPLTKDQVQWLNANSDLYMGPTGQPLIIITPYHDLKKSSKEGI